jgi:hypothetical protein
LVLLVPIGTAQAAAPAKVPHRLQPAVKSPVSAQESLSLLELADPRLKVELAAAEPQVLDPVAIAFDEKARMWVVEMGDYPNWENRRSRAFACLRTVMATDSMRRRTTFATTCCSPRAFNRGAAA